LIATASIQVYKSPDRAVLMSKDFDRASSGVSSLDAVLRLAKDLQGMNLVEEKLLLMSAWTAEG
jgi:hypothetical protein